MAKDKTISDINLKSHYGDKKPGEYPYTSGIYKDMYRKKLWTMRQYSGFSSASPCRGIAGTRSAIKI